MRALITGCLGQDGAYLSKYLQDLGYDVVGGYRAGGNPQTWRLEKIGANPDLVPFDLLEYSNMRKIIKTGFDEIYNLGAQSFVGVSFEQPILTANVDFMGVARILDIVKDVSPETKIYQASTSEMFGKAKAPQSKETSFMPRSPYGVAKLASHQLMINYRESYGMNCYNGILFNHESPLRGEKFVTQKIAKYFGKGDFSKPLELGNLNARRDWGYSGEYVQKMHELLQGEPRDVVLATGECHTVREFVELSAECVDMKIEWVGDKEFEKGYANGVEVVSINERYYRPAEVDELRGVSDYEMSVRFPELVRMMVNAV